MDRLRFITCGSVDDGKSTLIGRLLHDTRQASDDQMAALARDSAKHGTQGEALDFALLVDGLAAERELLDDLKPDRSSARDHFDSVEAVDVGVPVLGYQRLGVYLGLGDVVARENHGCAQLMAAGLLDQRCVPRHHHGHRNAKP